MCGAGFALEGSALNEALFHAVNALGPMAPRLWSALTVAGLAGVAWIIVAEARPAEGRTPARLLWLVVVGGLIVHLLKHALHVARPLGQLGAGAVNIVGEALSQGSMPSGHSATAAALATLLVIETGWATRRAAAASTGWIVLGVAICLSRIAVGAHWPGDVLVGAGLGLAFAHLACHAWPVARIARALATPVGRRVQGVTLLLALVEPFGATQPHHYADARWFAWALVPLAAWGAWQRWRRDLAPAEA